MHRLNPLLNTDFYKCCHASQYDPRIVKIVSYYTPRMSRIDGRDSIVLFGVQGTIKEWLIDTFNEWFFKRPLQEVVDEYNNYVGNGIGEDTYDIQRIIALHKLGYLPLQIRSLKEGSKVNIKVPMFEISNTKPEFAWVTNAVESLISANTWHPMTVATIGDIYFEVATEAFKLTVDDNIRPETGMCDFAFRGEESPEGGTRASAGWLLSFAYTATVSALAYYEDYYNTPAKLGLAHGLPSTEHSVMCSSAAIDGDEITMIKRLLTKVYPNRSFTMVSDSYDYWGLITNLLPQCKEEIMSHKGFFGIRGDSGDPVDIVCGELDVPMYESVLEARKAQFGIPANATGSQIFRVGDDFYEGFVEGYMGDNQEWLSNVSVEKYEPSVEELGTVEMLYRLFGGHINTKGYKVINEHLKAVYGDSITITRAKEIYRRLARKGFAANNVSLGVGSFSYQAIEQVQNGRRVLSPLTRDTYGIACKATYCELEDGKEIPIFKNPKTDKDNFKKSQKGCCVIYKDDKGQYVYEDGFSFRESLDDKRNLLQTVFYEGDCFNETTLVEMRKELHG